MFKDLRNMVAHTRQTSSLAAAPMSLGEARPSGRPLNRSIFKDGVKVVVVSPDAWELMYVFDEGAVDELSPLKWSVMPVEAHFGGSSMQTQYLQAIEELLKREDR
jgi:hypothetical protein